MRNNDCLGRKVPFRSSDETSYGSRSEDQPEDSPSKDKGANITHITLNLPNAHQVNLAIGDKAMVTTSPTESGMMTTQNIQITTPVSGKTPVQNPLSPTSTSPEHKKPLKETIVQTGGDSTYEIKLSMESDLEATKEARKPTQETPDPKKSLDFSEVEETKERPVQETVNPKNSITDTPETGNKTPQQFEDFSEGKPVQETEDLKCKKDVNDHPEGSARLVFQEEDSEEFIKDKPLQETEDPSNKKPKVEIEDQRDNSAEQKPLQETQGPGKAQGTEEEGTRQVKEDEEELSEGKPLQESASSEVAETESCKEEAMPTQETMAAGKVPFEETGLEVGVKGQPTDEQE
ncbi:hypothetical protein OS493_030865 [Desmophyllum pertusum]|uniref:Uncharacterized protein n=1 Tax=Desmophyllum pertusum TaxID=174260 RepID=A0A9W9Y8L3_9CNID|nr:hypothetical protein OS493_030865 [Desmophyllum pertusum]